MRGMGDAMEGDRGWKREESRMDEESEMGERSESENRVNKERS